MGVTVATLFFILMIVSVGMVVFVIVMVVTGCIFVENHGRHLNMGET
jgi:hypothetical protein